MTDPTCPACGVYLGGWREPRPEDRGKYAFIGSLPEDAPPSLLRSFQPLRWNDELSAYVFADKPVRRWQYWTTAGWVDLTSRVCVCERPSE